MSSMAQTQQAQLTLAGASRRFTRARAGAWLAGVPKRTTLAALAGVGVGVSLLGAPLAVGVGLSLSLPAALMILRRPWRGHRALARAVSLARRDAAAGRDALAELVEVRAAPAIRLEAAGRLAARALDAGELGEAVRVLEAARTGWGTRREARRERPRRALGLGLIGELMCSIVARLGVSRFEGVANSAALAPGNPQAPANEDDREDYVALLAMLELLEAEAGAPEPVLEAAWRRVGASVLARRYPGLASIVDAVAARRLPAARSTLEAAFEQPERARRLRTLLAGIVPELISELGEHGYRRPGVGERRSVSMERYRPPQTVAEQVRDHDTGAGAVRFGTFAHLAAGPIAVLTMQLPGVWPMLLLLALGLVTARIERRLRAGPIAAMSFGPTGAWLREIFDAPDAPRPLGDAAAPLRPDALALYLCCVRAEQALARGELAAAWDQVAWWFADRDNRHPPKLSLHPVASTLLRVACLSNHSVEARALAGVLEPGPPQRLRLSRRTVHGDAPRALALAKALVYARACAWTEAARALEAAAGEPGIITTERDEVLHALVAQRIQAMVPSVDPTLCAVSPRSVERVRPWLVRVWPQLIQRFELRRSQR